MLESCFHHFDSGFLFAGISIHQDEIRRRLEVLRVAYHAGGGHEAPAALEQRLGNAQADSAGGQ